MGQDYRDVFEVLKQFDELEVKRNTFADAIKDQAFEQLQGQIASARVPLNRFASKTLYWTLSGDDFSLDINNPHYLFPADFTAAHDLYMQRKRKRMEKENEERRREYEKEAKERELQRIIEQEKKAIPSITASSPTPTTIARTPSSSARLIDIQDTPLETIELSLTDGHILQCYGSHNQETQYHNEIITLVNQHSHLILAA